MIVFVIFGENLRFVSFWICVEFLLTLIRFVFFRSGCCFVICPSRQEADKAVNAYHNKKALPGVGYYYYY